MKNSYLAISRDDCTAIVKQIDGSLSKVKTTYDLVRFKGAELATSNNKKVIGQMVLDLNKFVNVSRTMSEGQIIETVNMMLDQYPNLTLQEYQFFFNRVKSGYYGQLYESLDGIKIMAFMREFYKDITKSWNDMINENDYRRKINEGCRDIDEWQKY